MTLIGKLFDGPLDIVGDVHGEIAALESLLVELGYDEPGNHPDDRRLVFVGDLVDRGRDSPAVLRKVRRLVQKGRAQCVLGNHELNLLRNDEKHGNSWWTNPQKKTDETMAPLNSSERGGFEAFLKTLPVALERDDLRVVHACWDNDAIEKLRAEEQSGRDVLSVFERFESDINETLITPELLNDAEQELQRHGYPLTDLDHKPDWMRASAEIDEIHQMGNPIRVLTSGVERKTMEVFKAGGKWRMVERCKWWDGYEDDVAVIVGHYWRRLNGARDPFCGKYGPDLFAGIDPHHWMGARDNVYCVDFSIGARPEQRRNGNPESDCSLAAIRIPAPGGARACEVVHDYGDVYPIRAKDE